LRRPSASYSARSSPWTKQINSPVPFSHANPPHDQCNRPFLLVFFPCLLLPCLCSFRVRPFSVACFSLLVDPSRVSMRARNPGPTQALPFHLYYVKKTQVTHTHNKNKTADEHTRTRTPFSRTPPDLRKRPFRLIFFFYFTPLSCTPHLVLFEVLRELICVER